MKTVQAVQHVRRMRGGAQSRGSESSAPSFPSFQRSKTPHFGCSQNTALSYGRSVACKGEGILGGYENVAEPLRSVQLVLVAV